MTINNSKGDDTEQFPNWRRNSNSYGNPPWKTGAALPFRQLPRDFLQDCWRSKAAIKPKSSTTRCCWDDRGGLAISKRLFTGLRLIFVFLDFPEETRKWLGPGTLTEVALTGTYSTCPSSNIFKILTPDRDAESSDDGLKPPTAYHCSCESLTALRRSTAWLTQAQTPANTCERDAVSTWLHGSKTALLVMLSQIAADSANIVTPESEKKFRWVKWGLLTKSSTQSRAPRTSSSCIMPRSRLMTNFSPKVTGPRTMRAVNWKTYKNKITYFWLNQPSGLATFGYDTYFKQMLRSTKTSLPRAKRQDITDVRAAPRRRPLQLSLLLDKGLVFSPTDLDLTTLYPPTFQKPIRQ